MNSSASKITVSVVPVGSGGRARGKRRKVTININLPTRAKLTSKVLTPNRQAKQLTLPFTKKVGQLFLPFKGVVNDDQA